MPPTQIQAVVDYVWAQLKLEHPPKVILTTRKGGAASRMKMFFNKDEPTKTWIILHEIAHSLTSTFDGWSAAHGPRFVTQYMKLLVQFAGQDMVELQRTADIAGVDYVKETVTRKI